MPINIGWIRFLCKYREQSIPSQNIHDETSRHIAQFEFYEGLKLKPRYLFIEAKKDKKVNSLESGKQRCFLWGTFRELRDEHRPEVTSALRSHRNNSQT